MSEETKECQWCIGPKDDVDVAKFTHKHPHIHSSPQPFNGDRILNSALDAIGNTPLIKINKICEQENIQCELLAKCEFFNAGGSVKDRIGKRMVLDAEALGRIKPGDTLIEPTSGNTGIGLALAAAIKGYKMVITLPEKMSAEKVNVLKALGAEIVRTPTEAAYDSPDSHIGVANRLHNEIPDSHILDQYNNPSNPLAHYDETAEEIIRQCNGQIDYCVMGAGTGGTVTGIGRKLKERIPGIKIIGVDPVGSILAQPDSLNDENRLQPYQVEGTGYDFIPEVLDRSVVDEWIKTRDHDSLIMSRRLIKEEGLLCGGSSGGSMWAAVQLCKKLPADKRVVVILPDSTRNYMTKFLSDEWMRDHGFVDDHYVKPAKYETWWANNKVSDLTLTDTPITITTETTCTEAINILNENGFDMLPVINSDNKLVGVVTEGGLTAKVFASRIMPNDACTSALYKDFAKVTYDTTLQELGGIFDREPYAVLINDDHEIQSVVTRIDLLHYITNNEP